MCGRTAQLYESIRAAAIAFLGRDASSSGADEDYDWKPNYNMSPGMSGTIFLKDPSSGEICMKRKVWGLVPRGGSANAPLPEGMSIHFDNLMFNARSDTLLEKRSFAPLVQQGHTCVFVVDGFFEWKAPALKGGKKQPYFVYNKNPNEPFLMIAGLWTTVKTGREADPTLDTFTIITTEACPNLRWLHTRMPLCIYNIEMAKEWLQQRPSSLAEVFRKLDDTPTPPDYFQWHAVTTEMSTTKFRSEKAIRAIPPPKTVKSFFQKVSSPSKSAFSTGHNTMTQSQKSPIMSNLYRQQSSDEQAEQDKMKMPSSAVKRSPLSGTESSTSPTKKRKTTAPAKTGPIQAYFSPKPK